MSSYLQSVLESDQSVEISQVPSDGLKEIQKILKDSKYYLGEIDGIFGSGTLTAFHDFKKDNHLGYPDLLGEYTAQQLLDLSGAPHPVSEQESAPPPSGKSGSKTGKTMTLPGGKLVYANEYILEGVPLTWGEFTKDCTRIPLDNSTVAGAIKFAKVFGEIRDKWGSPIGINSGYRPPAVNRAIGGARFSRHMQGDAGDIAPTKGDIYELLKVVKSSSAVGVGLGMRKGFIHVDCRPGVRVIFNY